MLACVADSGVYHAGRRPRLRPFGSADNGMLEDRQRRIREGTAMQVKMRRVHMGCGESLISRHIRLLRPRTSRARKEPADRADNPVRQLLTSPHREQAG